MWATWRGRRGSGCGVRDSSGAIPDSRIPNPETLPLADFLPALASFGIVLALVAALRDDDLELAHVGLGGRPARMAVKRRAAGQIRGLHRRLLRRGGLGRGGARSTQRVAQADGVLVVEGGVDVVPVGFERVGV